MSRNTRKPVFLVPDQVDTNRATLLLNMARDLKFRTEEVHVLYNPSSENKGADQLHGYCEADLRLCFCICKKAVFS